jgi:hypothetical protein
MASLSSKRLNHSGREGSKAMPQEECRIISEGLSGNVIEFLEKNVVIVADLDDQPRTNTGMAESMNPMVPLVAIRNFDALKDNDATGAVVYSLRESITGDLQAHYLPWNKNTGYYTVLDVNIEPTLFFTAMLSGCGVGFVESSEKTAVRISHHNIASFKTERNFEELVKSLAFTDAKVLPSQYRPGGDGSDLAHVHGVMRDNRWWFYAQFITMKYNAFKIKDVYQLNK